MLTENTINKNILNHNLFVPNTNNWLIHHFILQTTEWITRMFLHSLFLGFEHSFLKNFLKQLFGSVIFAPKAHLYQVL